MTDTPPEGWPTPDGETVVATRETLVGAPPPPPTAPVPPPEGGPGDRRIGAGMLLALGVLALIALGGVLAWLLTHRGNDGKQTTTVVVTSPTTAAAPKVAVPRLVGMKEQEALVRLGQVGLRPKEVFKPTSKPKDVVVSQSPEEATELKRGAQVTLVIDSGAPKVTLPDLTGMSFADAQAKLDRLGLDSAKTEVTSGEDAGTVVDQAPKADAKLAKGSTVTLSVAKAGGGAQQTTTAASTNPSPTTTAASTTPAEPQNATVPDVTGQSEASAVQAMGEAGILASLFFVPGTDTLGTVEGQAKPAGTTVPFHSHVQVNVSSGPGDKPKEQVPDVIGQTLPQAVSAMQGAHLRLIYLKLPVTSRAQAGKIVQQSPLGGGSAPQNAQVLVFLGAFQQ